MASVAKVKSFSFFFWKRRACTELVLCGFTLVSGYSGVGLVRGRTDIGGHFCGCVRYVEIYGDGEVKLYPQFSGECVDPISTREGLFVMDARVRVSAGHCRDPPPCRKDPCDFGWPGS